MIPGCKRFYMKQLPDHPLYTLQLQLILQWTKVGPWLIITSTIIMSASLCNENYQTYRASALFVFQLRHSLKFSIRSAGTFYAKLLLKHSNCIRQTYMYMSKEDISLSSRKGRFATFLIFWLSRSLINYCILSYTCDFVCGEYKGFQTN